MGDLMGGLNTNWAAGAQNKEKVEGTGKEEWLKHVNSEEPPKNSRRTCLRDNWKQRIKEKGKT